MRKKDGYRATYVRTERGYATLNLYGEKFDRSLNGKQTETVV